MTAVRTRGGQQPGAPRPTAGASRAAGRADTTERGGEARLRVHGRRVVSGRVLMWFSALLFFAMVAGGVTIQAQRVEAQRRLDSLRQQLAAEHDLNRSLRADVAIAESPERVIDAARSLRLVPPGPVVPLVPTLDAPPVVVDGADGG